MRIDRLSASKAKCWEMCPFKFFLDYIVKLPQKPSFAAELGSALHKIYERFAQAYIHGK